MTGHAMNQGGQKLLRTISEHITGTHVPAVAEETSVLSKDSYPSQEKALFMLLSPSFPSHLCGHCWPSQVAKVQASLALLYL